jgi:hypothetical protein
VGSHVQVISIHSELSMQYISGFALGVFLGTKGEDSHHRIARGCRSGEGGNFLYLVW